MFVSRERKAIEKTYKDTCNIYAFEKVKEKGITKQVKRLITENCKCALSQKPLSLRSSSQTSMSNEIQYDIKLFISPEISIPAGSEIEVSSLNRVIKFISSGESFIYETHQELILKRKDKA